jgi:serine/threonine-protein kinase
MSACPRCGAPDAGGRLSVCPRCLVFGGGEELGEIAHADADAGLPTFGPPWLRAFDELGQGGMGRVFRAHDDRLGRDVAVKVLRPESAADPDFRARFAREARTLARLEHPGIVGIYDFGTTPAGESYIVMQLVSGGSLAERLPLPAGEAVVIARQICDALAYAHARGVIHRDIKPENVLMSDDGRAKLSDFGIARLLEPKAGDGPLTRPSLVLGTPGYMAPEARAGAAPSPRMDIYAVGALLAHMVTGRHPDGTGASPSTTAHAVPPALQPLIARAMATDPAQRTESATALGRELDAVAARVSKPRDSDDDLPPEERIWRGAVALLAAVATAIAIYAVVVSLTPRAFAPGEALPLTTFGRQLSDGRVLTRAHFEVWPTLGATVAIAFALVGYGLLRRHWRLAGMDRPAPERRLPGARRLQRLGIFLFVMFLVREALARAGAIAVASYIPVIGGSFELAMLYLFWDTALESQRTSRSLLREPRLWIGVALSLFPPAFHLVRLLTDQYQPGG